MVDNSIKINCNGSEKGNDAVVITVNEVDELCRICHLRREHTCELDNSSSKKSSSEMILIGCECKGELGFAHRDCAEAWFGVRGNRYCEICGVYAKNIKGQDDGSFMEEWEESMILDDTDHKKSSLERIRKCAGLPICKFLTGCLIVFCILPWFFRSKLL